MSNGTNPLILVPGMMDLTQCGNDALGDRPCHYQDHDIRALLPVGERDTIIDGIIK